MKSKSILWMTGALGAWLAFPACAAEHFQVSIGADMWFGDTKINEIRRDHDAAPSGYITLENDFAFVPNARFRYTTVDSNYLAFDKYDLTLYYRVLDHELMHFNAGVSLMNLSDTEYRNAYNNQRSDFDETEMTWFLAAELNVPNTPADIVGEVNFADNNGFKSTDFIAALQYRMPTEGHELVMRGGYRVIDLQSEKFSSPTLGDSYVFVDGWFVGMRYQF